MKIKTKSGVWGFIIISLIPIIWFSFIYYLVEPLQSKYANNMEQNPPYMQLALLAVFVGIALGIVSYLSACLQSIYKSYSVDGNTEPLTWSDAVKKNPGFLKWAGGWVIAQLLILLVWALQL